MDMGDQGVQRGNRVDRGVVARTGLGVLRGQPAATGPQRISRLRRGSARGAAALGLVAGHLVERRNDQGGVQAPCAACSVQRSVEAAVGIPRKAMHDQQRHCRPAESIRLFALRRQ